MKTSTKRDPYSWITVTAVAMDLTDVVTQAVRYRPTVMFKAQASSVEKQALVF